MKKIALFCLLILVFPLFCSISYAKIVEETGYACASNLEIAKKKALKNAEEKAISSCIGLLIDSRILTVNNKLVRKTIQTLALGKVKVIKGPEVISSQIHHNTICVKIKATLKVDKKEFYRSNFGLKLVLNKKNLKSGEFLKIFMYSQKKCYPYLFSVDSMGHVFRLLPNSIEKTPVLKGKMVFPTKRMETAGIVLAVFPNPEDPSPHQVEEIVFICTKEREDVLLSFFPEAFVGNPQKLKESISTASLFSYNSEKLAEILEQIGLNNYEMIADFYTITR